MDLKTENNELEFKILDKISLLNETNLFNGLEISESGHLCVITNAGLYMLHFRGYMINVLKIFPFSKMFFKPSDYSICESLEVDPNNFIDSLPRYDLYQFLLQPDVYPKMKSSNKSQAVSVKFSPPHLIFNNQCAVAVLTNFGSLEVYVRRVEVNYLEEYVCVCNISQCLLKKLDFDKNKHFNNELDPTEQLKNLRNILDTTVPLSFVWSHLINFENTKFCILIVGHGNSDLNFWKFKSLSTENVVENDDNALFLKKIRLPDVKKITNLHWIKAGNENGLLLLGDSTGKVFCLCVYDISENDLSVSEKIPIFDENDSLKVDFFKVYKNDGNIYLFIVKRSFLFVIVLDQQGKVVGKESIYVDYMQITALEHYENNLYFVLTFSGTLLQLKLNWENGKLKMFNRHIHLKINFGLRRAQGLYISPNKVFMCILAPFYKLKSVRKTKDIIALFVLKNCSKDPLEILLNHRDENIGKYWDCLETIRISCFYDKVIPSSVIPRDENYDNFSLAKLKTYYWLSKISEGLIDKVSFVEKYNLKPSDVIKQILKIKLTVKHMNHLFEILEKNGKLSNFQLNTMFLHNLFLKEIIYDEVFDKIGLGENVIKSIEEVLKKSNCLEYLEAQNCFICKEKILGPKCSPFHEDNRCSISDMQIIFPPYFKCPYCKGNVHKEIESEYNPVLCPFCDVVMDFVNDNLIGNRENSVDALEESIDSIEDDKILKEIEYIDLFNISDEESTKYDTEMIVDEIF